MGKLNRKKGRLLFAVLCLSIVLTIIIISVSPPKIKALQSFPDGNTEPLVLKINEKKGARLFCSEMLIAPSIGGRFAFFQRKLDGGRKRVYEGSPYGLKCNCLTRYSGEEYSFADVDPSTGVEYHIHYKKQNTNELIVSFTFKSPNAGLSLSFEILTLVADFFLGNKIDTMPFNSLNPGLVPVEPRSLNKRTLFKKKNKIRFHGKVFDLEIVDLNKSRSINVADFRKVHWAKFKGLYFYVTKHFLIPGKEYTFSFSIRMLNPKNSPTIRDDKGNCDLILKENVTAFFDIPPKEENKAQGNYFFRSTDVIFGNSRGSAELILQKELNKKKIQAKIQPMNKDLSPSDIRITRPAQTPENGFVLPPEGFEIVIAEDNILIRGADERGCIYGVRALLGRIIKNGDEIFVPCGIIRDWPDIAYRGACLSSDFVPSGNKDIGLYKRYLDAVSISRGNFVIFYHKPAEISAWLKGLKSDKYWSPEEMLEVVEYARFLKLDVWAGMTAKFSKNKFPDIDIAEGSNFYNPMDTESYQLLFALYEQIINLYNPSHFLIGHDEIKGLNYYSDRYNIKPANLLINDIDKIHTWLSERQITTVMAGDMLLDGEKWGTDCEPANSQNILLNSGATHLSINDIPNDVMILDWHYNTKKSCKSIQYFKNKGFQVIGSSYHSPIAGCLMAKSVLEFDGQGIVATNFGFWRTLSPASTTLYTLLCGWSSSLPPDPLNNDVIALSSLLRGTSDKSWSIQYPISLNSIFNNTTWDIKSGDEKGLLDIGPILDLRQLPKKDCKFGGISFYLPNSQKGMLSNCLVLSNTKNNGHQQQLSVTLTLDNEFSADALAFLHTLYTEEPNYNLQKIGKYEIEYSDGGIANINIISGWNITDIRSKPGVRINNWSFSREPDLLIGSELVWRGQSYAGIPLNLQMFVAQNPFPEKNLKKIRITINQLDNNYKLVLIGITGLKK